MLGHCALGDAALGGDCDAPANLLASQSIAAPSQVAEAEILRLLAANQSLSVEQTATVTTELGAVAAQTVPAPLQTALLQVGTVLNVVAAQSVTAPTQAALVDAVAGLVVAHAVTAPSQAAALGVHADLSAAQAVGVPQQDAVLDLHVDITGAQIVTQPANVATTLEALNDVGFYRRPQFVARITRPTFEARLAS